MPYKEAWGPKAQARSKKRLEYFKQYQNNRLAGTLKRVLTVGWIGELIAKAWFTSGKIEDKKTYDLKWLRKRVEIKCSSFGKRGWCFNIPSKQRRSHYFLLICLAGSGKVARMFFVPKQAIKVICLKMGSRNLVKFEQFRIV